VALVGLGRLREEIDEDERQDPEGEMKGEAHGSFRGKGHQPRCAEKVWAQIWL
jgi:hypothetical protein